MGEESSSHGYSIRVASRLTGVSSDTLRMWERRYGFPKPGRNDSQVRVYTDGDVERLMLVSRALKAGFRAGEVIHKDAEELRALLSSSAQAKLGSLRESPSVEAALNALLEDDPLALRAVLRRAVATLGPRQFLIDVAGPLVEQVGEAWAAGRLHVRHEHLFTEALSSQLLLLLSAYETEVLGPTVLLATLSHEQHGLGMVMAALYLALEGASPRLLGVDTPPDQIVEAALALEVSVVGLSISGAADREQVLEHVRWMLAQLPACVQIWLGGKASRSIEADEPRLQCVADWADVDRELRRVRNMQTDDD